MHCLVKRLEGEEPERDLDCSIRDLRTHMLRE
jgi:hypothetical protein